MKLQCSSESANILLLPLFIFLLKLLWFLNSKCHHGGLKGPGHHLLSILPFHPAAFHSLSCNCPIIPPWRPHATIRSSLLLFHLVSFLMLFNAVHPSISPTSVGNGSQLKSDIVVTLLTSIHSTPSQNSTCAFVLRPLRSHRAQVPQWRTPPSS